MRKLETKEWVAIVASVFIVGIFFIPLSFTQSIFKNSNNSIFGNETKMKIQDIKKGEGAEAVSGDRVTVHYVGHFVDGSIFDSSISRKEPFQFILGAGQVIPGWDQGIIGMQVGGIRVLTIPPELAYGASGYGPIPANATLVFEVQLLKAEK